jgi:hypothetical protein
MTLLRRRPPSSGRRRGEGRPAAPRSRIAVVAAAVLILGGGGSLGVAIAEQHHAPRPSAAAAGTLASPPRRSPPATSDRGRTAPDPAGLPHTGPVLVRSTPVSITIPAIGVHSQLLDLGINPNGTIQVPPLNDTPATNEAAWFRYSPTPGELGASVIEGHIDSVYQGPSVFFRLASLRPGDAVDVTLADRVVAVFQVDGVRQFAKAGFPTSVLYGDPGYAALRLVTCGGAFDSTTHSYLSSIVVSAHLMSSHPAA